MAYDHRKLLMLPTIITNSGGGSGSPCEISCDAEKNHDGDCLASCFKLCPQVFRKLLSAFDDPLCPPSPPPPPRRPYVRPLLPPRPPCARPLPPPSFSKRDTFFTTPVIKFGLIFTATVLAAVLLFGLIRLGWRFYKSRQIRRNSSSPILFHTQESFRDENQEPEVFHPIWYINTVGLQQSVIDSITVCKYKKDEGLIEGTDCSVCLTEFEEDESLRLLPKCSHAFHITCIDTWLRSHKNCPLCRAPIVCDNYAERAQSSLEANSNDLDSNEEAEQDNVLMNDNSLVGEQVVGGETNELRIGEHNSPVEVDTTNAEDLREKRNYHSRVQSDSSENRQGFTEGEVQPMRRSVSMDLLSAMRIYNTAANVVVPGDHLVAIKNSKSNTSSKRRSGSFSVIKMMRSSSVRPFLMKRSSSSSGKPSSSRRNRSHDSILPL